MNSLFTAATGMEAQQTRISVISNNLANLGTTGFKASKAVFQDLLYQTLQEPGAETTAGVNAPAPLQVGTGVKVVSTPSIFGQGVLEQTGRDLDMAIEGDGFIQVSLPDGGTGYTRMTSLAIDQDGNLVTQQGDQVEPAISGLAQVGGLSIGLDGTVSGTPAGSDTVQNLGQIQLATFPNPGGLKAVGRSTYLETPASGSPTTATPGSNGAGVLRQGFLEGSNVNVAEELIRMVLAQRAFELNSRVVRTSDEMMQSVSNMR